MINQDKLTRKPYEMNALTLAYIGDAVYELYIRQHVIAKGGKPNILHRKTISYVSAVAQSNIINSISTMLTDDEREIVRRGRNAKSSSNPRNVGVIVYRYSTAFETLIGFLYLTNNIERLEEIIEMAIHFIEGNRDGEQDGK